VLLNWQRKTLFKNPGDWVFASPFVAGQKTLISMGSGAPSYHSRRHSLRHRAYRLAMDESKGAALGKVVRLVLPAQVA